ncbi:IS1 family transposase [Bradyrhizobium elkanii]
MPGAISTSYVERQNLTLRMTQKRFARFTNGFSKKLDHHAAAVSPNVAHCAPLPSSRSAA